MKEKAVKYALHIRGKGQLGPIKYDLNNLDFLPTFNVGHLVALKAFDSQYEHGDRAIVKEVVWDFLSDDNQTVIHQFVTILEETTSEQVEKSSRNKESGA
jgi:hypothetical protein